MTLEALKTLQASGEFHHATYRNFGTLWEGLWIYQKYEGLRGFEPVGAFLKDVAQPEELTQAIELCKGHSVGSYGRG